MTRGSGHCDVRGIWGFAMTARFGRCGIHESRCDADGRPSAETLAAFPRIGEQMREAAENINKFHMWRLEG